MERKYSATLARVASSVSVRKSAGSTSIRAIVSWCRTRSCRMPISSCRNSSACAMRVSALDGNGRTVRNT